MATLRPPGHQVPAPVQVATGPAISMVMRMFISGTDGTVLVTGTQREPPQEGNDDCRESRERRSMTPNFSPRLEAAAPVGRGGFYKKGIGLRVTRVSWLKI